MTMTRTNRGFSLVELMIALVLGLLLTGVMLTAFSTASKSARTQTALLRVLDNGRYASQYLSDELRQVGGQYCTGLGDRLPNGNGLTPRRPFVVNVKTSSMLPAWVPAGPTSATVPYEVDPGVLVRGYDCKGSTCSPALPTSSTDTNVVPAVGVTTGSRAAGTDVLTVRYLRADGVTVAKDAGNASPIDVGAPVGAAPLNFGKSDLGMIANCGFTEVFATSASGTSLSHAPGDGNYVASLVTAFTKATDARVFNFSKDFVSVTYYVGITDDLDVSSRKVASLMRIVNGGTPEAVVDGVERFDLTFVVQDGDGRTHYLSAKQVDDNAPAATCPPVLMTAPPAAGCLWRGVNSVEVSMLMNSVSDSDEAGEPFRYSPDSNAVQTYAATATLPNGLPAGRMKRREFRFLANLHSLNR